MLKVIELVQLSDSWQRDLKRFKEENKMDFVVEMMGAAKDGLVAGIKEGIKDGIKDGVKDMIKTGIKTLFEMPKKYLS